MLKIHSNAPKCDVFTAIPIFNFSALYYCYWGYPLAHCGLNDRNSSSSSSSLYLKHGEIISIYKVTKAFKSIYKIIINK